jgi:hypothetical protein
LNKQQLEDISDEEDEEVMCKEENFLMDEEETKEDFNHKTHEKKLKMFDSDDE